MSDQQEGSVGRRIVEEYFRTTSGAAARPDSEGFRASAEGLRRRLGRWLVGRGMHALDLGSGTGELCWLLRDIGARRVVGVNLSREEIEFASSRVEAQFVCQDVLAYLESVQSESIDVAYALNFLEHLDKETLVRVLSQVHRCLRANGRLVAMVPNATSPFAGMTRYWDITHQIAFTPASVAQLGRLLGYSSWEFRECGPVPHGVVSAVRRLLWLAIRSLIKAYLLVELGSSKGGIYTADMLFRLTKHTNGQH